MFLKIPDRFSGQGRNVARMGPEAVYRTGSRVSVYTWFRSCVRVEVAVLSCPS